MPVLHEPRPPYGYLHLDDALQLTFHEPDARVEHLPEAVLHDLWQHRRFDTTALWTTDGLALDLVSPGQWNTDGGPDFRNACLRVSDGHTVVELRGDIEIHRTSGGWRLHRHDEDPRYNSVILHVVLVADRHTGTLRRQDGTPLPELLLYDQLQAPLRTLLHQFFSQPRTDFPCAAAWPRVPDSVKQPLLTACGEERLRHKAQRLMADTPAPFDLERACAQGVFRALGYAKNSEPMADLARRLPLDRLRGLDLPTLEALLLGLAGLLPAPASLVRTDRQTAAYTLDLRNRFWMLRELDPDGWGTLPAMTATQWQFFRLRPANFPTRRLAQAAALLASGGLLHDDPLGRLEAAVRSSKPLHALRATLVHTAPSPFWTTHVRLDRRAASDLAPGIGTAHADVVLVNALLPTLLLLAEQANDAALEARVFDVLRAMPPQPDEVTRRYTALGTQPHHALDTQGLHQLYKTRCTQAACLTCPVAARLLAE